MVELLVVEPSLPPFKLRTLLASDQSTHKATLQLGRPQISAFCCRLHVAAERRDLSREAIVCALAMSASHPPAISAATVETDITAFAATHNGNKFKIKFLQF